MLQLDAQALYAELRDGVRGLIAQAHPPRPGGPHAATAATEAAPVLVGIWSGGAWLAERLHADLQLPGDYGVISSTLHRDDYSSRGLAGGADATRLPFSIDGRNVVLVDDVLHTGRTIRAVVNELFDFGRPASVQLAVLVDRGGRELPIAAAYAAAKIALPPRQRLSLARDAAGSFEFSVEDVA